jgi:hypothetical protein
MTIKIDRAEVEPTDASPGRPGEAGGDRGSCQPSARSVFLREDEALELLRRRGAITCGELRRRFGDDLFSAGLLSSKHVHVVEERAGGWVVPLLALTPAGARYPLAKKKRGQIELLEPPMPDVLVINYHKLHGWADELAGKIRYVVFDEVQELRRPSSDKYHAAKRIAHAAAYRIGLSATPIYNYGDEFHAIFEVLAADELGTKGEFDASWVSGTKTIADPLAFGAYLRDHALMLRRTRRDVARELPALSIVPHTVDADTRILAQADGRAFELARIVLDRNKQAKGAKLHASEELSGLVRQQTGIAKAAFVAEFVSLLCEAGEKVLLFGWHHEVYGIWRTKLAHLNPAFFTGAESPTQKEAAKTAFVEGDAQVLIMSLRAGAGIDGLQKVCRTVVFGELDWSPGVHEQATGRIYRDGQADPVVAYYLLAEDGSDPIVADVLGVKRGQIEPVRNPDGTTDLVQVDEARVRRLAEDYLKQRGMSLPAHQADEGTDLQGAA